MRGPITLGAKRAGKPGAGDPHAGFDVAGAGDVAMGAGLRPEAKAEDEPPDPTVRAPVLDPTDGRGVETGQGGDTEAPATERVGNS
jgi:hypothetical protein